MHLGSGDDDDDMNFLKSMSQPNRGGGSGSSGSGQPSQSGQQNLGSSTGSTGSAGGGSATKLDSFAKDKSYNVNDLPEADLHFGTFGEIIQSTEQIQQDIKQTLHEDAGEVRSLVIVVCLSAMFLVLEVVVGLYMRSLAVLSDGLHAFGDVAAGALALGIRVAARRTNRMYPMGLSRIDSLGGFATAGGMIIMAFLLLIKGISSFGVNKHFSGGALMAIAVVSAVVNLVGLFLLHRPQDHSDSIRGLYLHMLGDLAGSIGIFFTGLLASHLSPSNVLVLMIDPLVSIMVALFIIVSSVKIVIRCARVLLLRTPAHINVEHALYELKKIRFVESIHELRIWSVSQGTDALSVHLVYNGSSVNGSTDPAAEIIAAATRMITSEFRTVRFIDIVPENSTKRANLPCNSAAPVSEV